MDTKGHSGEKLNDVVHKNPQKNKELKKNQMKMTVY
jgi:hypothetical protein